MSKEINNYLHLHLGCEVCFEQSNYHFVHNYAIHKGDIKILTASLLHCIEYHSNKLIFKPILRPLSDMTEEEIIHLLWVNNDSEQLDADCRISKEEIIQAIDEQVFDKEHNRWRIMYSCRCFVGTFIIEGNGDMELYDEDDDLQGLENRSESFRYLLKQHFDLFNLIPEGLAIDKTKIKTNV